MRREVAKLTFNARDRMFEQVGCGHIRLQDVRLWPVDQLSQSAAGAGWKVKGS
jgi:hypothetical protein